MKNRNCKYSILLIALCLMAVIETNGTTCIESAWEKIENTKQEQYFIKKPKVGEQVPHFVLTDVAYYKESIIDISSLKGKWVFLDFWFSSCASCINGFPKINELQKKYSEKAQFILVGQSGDSVYHGSNIKKIYNALQRQSGFTMAAAYDSTLAFKWEIPSMPYMVIINPNGTVVAITTGNDLTEEKLNDLFSGNPVVFQKVSTERPVFDGGIRASEQLNNAPLDSNVLFRSLLTKYTDEDYSLLPKIDHQLRFSQFKRKGYKIAGAPLVMLYNLAYWGDGVIEMNDSICKYVYPFPVLDGVDSTNFKYDENGRGSYNYSLTVPANRESIKDIQFVMQGDLRNYFQYDVSVEYREMGVWQLTSDSTAQYQLSPKDLQGKTTVSGNFSQIEIKNGSLKKNLIPLLYLYLPGVRYMGKLPLVDRTSMETPIDILLEGDLTKVDVLKRELNKFGLDITMGKKKYKVLVLRPARNDAE